MPIKRLFLSLIVLSFVFSANAHVKLEAMTVILSEKEARQTFTVANPGKQPVLLIVKVQDLDSQQISKQIIISPPITRIEPGESQQINFILKPGPMLSKEVLMLATFESLAPSLDNSTSTPIRQSIGFLLQPRSLASTETPWRALHFTINKDRLTLYNSGKHVVRMSPKIELEPAKVTLPLDKLYLLPQQSISLQVPPLTEKATLTPLSRYGFVLPPVTFTIFHD